MRKSLFYISAIFLTLLFSSFFTPKAFSENSIVSTELVEEGSDEEGLTAVENEEETSHSAPAWTVIPFVLLLLMIATGPLFYEHFWHKNYPKIAVILAVLVVSYYLFVIHNMHSPVHAAFEYIQFISLLASLYIASGGIVINVNKKSTPFVNVAMLLIGAAVSNLIGTTGASMLLIRPFIRLNKNRIKAYHIIFFIFMVSNVGGSLTPIGDPPLFLGFLKGVPFFWTLEHNWPAWIFALTILSIAFYILDKRNKSGAEEDEKEVFDNKITINGKRNFLWLAVIIVSVFIDPNVFSWVPGITYDGQQFSYIREVIMLSVTYLSYKFAKDKVHELNEFSFEPIREVAFIFIGIFGTMMPALDLVGDFAKSETGAALITHNTLYWGTGVLSGFLDNAPTYLNFLAAAMASQGGSISVLAEVTQFANGGVFYDSVADLTAISIAAVFFGAMTYIGNGPNFMVKSIAEQVGIKMPSFFGYIIRFSIPFLLPLLLLVWLLFIR
jgi:Na+/H+ antiporter NhaD/arsenite permease-like protein